MAVLKNLVLPAVIMLVMVLSMALGSTAARPLPGEELPGEAAVGDSIVRFIRQLYWQRLNGPGPSCKTWSPNNRCPPPP
ncbi:unnamed protein product [Miscanthus lutarioriparius]|uniref:Uncharacterized protein n=1 Tax=Miscanthus lutarioriparius TaxID=422564 RepID=A0A811PUL8_9POAL|nr:unnamed protein product [Miscanthus lutarioriparius]